MATLLGFLPGAAPSRGFATLRAKQRRLAIQWQHARRQRKEIARITRELETYTDRELSGLGLSRCDIPDVARGKFPG